MEKKFDADFYRKVLDRINANIYITDVETDEIVYVNEYMKKAFRLGDEEGKLCWQVIQRGMTERCDFCKIEKLKKAGEGAACVWREKNSATGRVYMNHDTLQNWNGRTYHIQDSLDITAQMQLSMEASIDELTGVLNRNAGKKKLDDLLRCMGKDESFTVSLYDINGLKWVNDTYGHLEGDRLLVFVAQSIRKNLEGNDFIFRLSGDEFIVVFLNKSVREAEMWMQRMLGMLEERRLAQGMHYDVTFSYGFANITAGKNLSVSDVLSIADSQMYIRKRDHHIQQGDSRLKKGQERLSQPAPFQLNRSYLFEALAECTDEYLFAGNLKTGEFLHSYRMMIDFGLPAQVLGNSSAFWGERIHPEDRDEFLRCNQEIVEGRAERYTVSYRVKNVKGQWVHLLATGRMIRDDQGVPDIVAGTVRNLDLERGGKRSDRVRELPELSINKEELEEFVYQTYLEKSSRSWSGWNSMDDEEDMSNDCSFYFMQKLEGSEWLRTEIKLLHFVNSNIPCGIIAVYDEPGFPLFCFNEAILHYLGYTEREFKELYGGNFDGFIYEEDRQFVYQEIVRQLARNQQYGLRYRVKTKDGKLIWIYDRGRYVPTGDNRRLILSFFMDISHEMQIEQEMSYITESITDGVFKAAIAEGFPILYANEGYYRIHGYTREQMEEELGNTASRLVYEGDLERIKQEIQRVLANHERQAVLEYRIRRRDGTIAWVHTAGGLATMQDGTNAIIRMTMDITERKQLEEQLQRAERMFNMARKHTMLNVWEYDIEHRVLIRDPNSQRLRYLPLQVDRVPESLIEMGLIHPDSISADRSLYERMMAGEKEVSAEIQVRGCKEEPFWWEKVTYTVIDDKDGKPVWAIGVSEDITAQKEAQIRVFREETMREILSKDMLFNFRINLTTDRLEEMLGYTDEWNREEIKNSSTQELYDRIYNTIANKDDRRRFAESYTPEKIREYARQGKVIPNFEFRKQHNGSILWVLLNMRVVTDPENGDLILLSYARNIDLQKKRELVLRKKAERDGLTGFYNYATLKLLMEGILRHSNQTQESCAMLMLNVDDFKRINQDGGFLMGDSVLRQMAGIIRKNMIPQCITGRISGDAFLLFYYDMESADAIYRSAQTIWKELCGTYRMGRDEVKITVSGGLAYLFSADMSYDQLYQAVMHVVDSVKRSGKNKLMTYQQVEGIGENAGIKLVVDMESWQVREMNQTGLISFGMSSVTDPPVKCYELLHHRTEPCPFCNRDLEEGKPKIWECFVSGLNKLMYVREGVSHQEGRDLRNISMQERPFETGEVLQDTEFYSILDDAWTKVESGAPQDEVIQEFMGHLAAFYRAARVVRYEKKSNRLVQEQVWQIAGLELDCSERGRHPDELEALMQKIRPHSSLTILDKHSMGYSELCRYYGEEKPKLPVVLAGTYRGQELKRCLVLEKACRNIRTIKPLEIVLAFIRRCTALYGLREQYQYAVRFDHKTGLQNYESFIYFIEHTNEDLYSSFGMVRIHIVDLRSYNQTYGLQKGDELLLFAAQTLQKVFGRSACYRISGASFVALCPDMTYESFNEKYEQMEELMAEHSDRLLVSARVWEENDISIGRLQMQLEEKIQVADNRQRSKNSTDDFQTVFGILKEVRAAIDKGRFCTYLQPKAKTKTGEICGAEALVRYYDQEKGTIPPSRFLPYIEKAGLIRYIDLFVLRDVCRLLRQWMACGREPLPISLNFSRSTILEPGILEEVNRIVESFDIPKQLLEIEVTETIGSIDNASLKAIVNQFVQAGYQIALDDFGAKYSNIYVLYSLNISTLKLDRRIISDIYHDNRARLVVKQIIELCRQLGITSVAEGVETEQHLEILREMDCDVIQGYYLNKPLPENEFYTQYLNGSK